MSIERSHFVADPPEDNTDGFASSFGAGPMPRPLPANTTGQPPHWEAPAVIRPEREIVIEEAGPMGFIGRTLLPNAIEIGE